MENSASSLPEQRLADIICTYCDISVQAVKTCLLCEASLCDNHLIAHNSKTEGHTLIDPINLCKQTCLLHNESFSLYCSDDKVCFCFSCYLTGEHSNHHVESMEAALTKKKDQIRNALENVTFKRKQVERRSKDMYHQKRDIVETAAGLIIRISDVFRDLRAQLEALENKVLRKVFRQKELALQKVSHLIMELEKEKDKLSKKMHEIEELFYITNPTVLLKAEVDLTMEESAENNPTDDVQVMAGHDEVFISVTLQKKLENIMSSQAARGLYVQEESDLRLDEDTASSDVALSGDMKSATCSLINLLRPESPARFYNYQVLSTKSFQSGHHYWVFECSKDRYWRVGVTYGSVKRMGYESWVGNNKKSWCLRRFNRKLSALHGSQDNVLLPSSLCQRFGVHLDYEAGRLSFYQLDKSVAHLHTFRASFTEPLHVACWVWWGGWITVRS
ncbi:E3 ubiquitin/ISG15 ligase TRIM25 [Xenopus laevis]|uniref:B30.2/SPRY domain-containing protein n=2 Tax=Xenopus laevis TaxID=8355 RepID=A0A974H4W5_XENLA|nr:E3 ubiquitin/ISG15 ligase TRIM25 [Xenopus laevis]OCT64580.1 hypothetical protein XELAEV_18045679mg [Xenopus laevis]